MRMHGDNLIRFLKEWDEVLEDFGGIGAVPETQLELRFRHQMERFPGLRRFLENYEYSIRIDEKERSYKRLRAPVAYQISANRFHRNHRDRRDEITGHNRLAVALCKSNGDRRDKGKKSLVAAYTVPKGGCPKWYKEGTCLSGDGCPYRLHAMAAPAYVKRNSQRRDSSRRRSSRGRNHDRRFRDSHRRRRRSYCDLGRDRGRRRGYSRGSCRSRSTRYSMSVKSSSASSRSLNKSKRSDGHEKRKNGKGTELRGCAAQLPVGHPRKTVHLSAQARLQKRG